MKRSGITLVEMLAALAICGLMMVAITGVLSGLIRQQRRLVHVSKEWQVNFQRLLWTDLSQARLVATIPSGIALRLPDSKVVYYLTMAMENGDRALVRTTVKKDHSRDVEGPVASPNLLGGNATVQTVSWSISDIEFHRGDMFGTIQPIPPTWSPAPASLHFRLSRPMPPSSLSQWITVR